MRKVTVKIEGKVYDVTLEDNFAESVEEELRKILPSHTSITSKALLQAYLAKCRDCYILEKKMKELLKKLPKD